MNIPNVITLGRVILVPLVFWFLITDRLQLAFLTFIIAGISDAVDGFVAKRFGMQTTLGAYLDPMADKLLIVSIFLALGFKGELPSWLVVAVVSRDILIVLGVLLFILLSQPVVIRPLMVSKANTAAQIVLAAIVLADQAFELRLDALREVLIWTTGVLTLWSLSAYIGLFVRHASSDRT